ncbi:MAG: undecaprenyl-phosphate glucose phosphotransferase [Pseudomonadota bacterium]
MHDLISRNPSRLECCLRLLDVAVLVAAGELAGLLQFHRLLHEVAPIHAILLYFCSALAALVFLRLDIYVSWRGRALAQLLLRLALSWGLVLLLGIVFGFLIHQAGALSRLWVCYWFAGGLLMLVGSRALAYSVLNTLRRMGLNCKRVLIIGYGAIGRALHRRAVEQAWCGYEVRAVHAGADDGAVAPPIAPVATLAEVPQFVAANQIDEIWITLPMTAAAQLRELPFLLRNALVDIRWIPDTLSMQILSSRMVDFLGFPAVELNRPNSSGLNGLVKDVFDRLFAAVVLVALAPLFVALAAAVKLSSPGPVFFKQERLGLDGKKFLLYKFRSMKLHQEHGTLTQAKRDDPRISRIGHFLRSSSLDELPQFLNVLAGHMSVVGPRPHALLHNEMYKDVLELYMLRHRVKPGITGWAQIHGFRGETDTVDKMAGRVKCDLYYIRHWSLWLDLRIIAWTALKGWSDKNAY